MIKKECQVRVAHKTQKYCDTFLVSPSKFKVLHEKIGNKQSRINIIPVWRQQRDAAAVHLPYFLRKVSASLTSPTAIKASTSC